MSNPSRVIRTRYIFSKVPTENDVLLMQAFVEAMCVQGAHCRHPDGVRIICQVQFSTRHQMSWLLNQPGFLGAEVASGQEAKELTSLFQAQAPVWSWAKAKEQVVAAVPVREVVPDNSVTNNVFNLNVYLQESCQNAPNLADFVKGIAASMTDIDYENDRATWDYAEKLAHMPYADGVSKLLTDKLEELSQVDRPIQCTDGKRGAFQIKHLGEWQSGHMDDAVGTPFRDALHSLGQTRVGYAIRWKQQHLGEEYGADHASIMKNVVAGVTTQQTASARRQIVSALAKQTLIEK
jgi:hypothetical protein